MTSDYDPMVITHKLVTVAPCSGSLRSDKKTQTFSTELYMKGLTLTMEMCYNQKTSTNSNTSSVAATVFVVFAASLILSQTSSLFTFDLNLGSRMVASSRNLWISAPLNFNKEDMRKEDRMMVCECVCECECKAL